VTIPPIQKFDSNGKFVRAFGANMFIQPHGGRAPRQCRRDATPERMMAPGANHGTDADADGQGIVTGQRLYQLIRQSGDISDHTSIAALTARAETAAARRPAAIKQRIGRRAP